jgi:hypothetical protein
MHRRRRTTGAGVRRDTAAGSELDDDPASLPAGEVLDPGVGDAAQGEIVEES